MAARRGTSPRWALFEDTWHAQTALIFPAREGWGSGVDHRTHMYTRALVYRCKCRSTRRAIHSIRAYGALNSDGAGGLDGTHFACVSMSARISCVMVRRSLGSRENLRVKTLPACTACTHTHIVVFATRLRRGRAFLFQYKNIRTKQEDCLCLCAPPFIRYIDVTTPSPASALPRKKSTQSGLCCL